MAEIEGAIPILEEVMGAGADLSGGGNLDKEAPTIGTGLDPEQEPLRKKIKIEVSSDGEVKMAGNGTVPVGISAAKVGGDGLKVDSVANEEKEVVVNVEEGAAVAVAVASAKADGDGMEVDITANVKEEVVVKVVEEVAVGQGEGNVKKEEDSTGKEQKVPVEGAKEGPPAIVRYKKRKIAILMAYIGAGYQGMQRNPGAKTIEGELELALHRAGAIPQENFGDPKSLDWMRSARTDKGVSAVGQVVSGLFIIDPPGLVERVNQELPPQIRVFDFIRVTKSFSAKQLCDRRRYEYVLPTFAFDPEAHRERAYYDGSATNPSKETGESMAEARLESNKQCSTLPPGNCDSSIAKQATADNGTGFQFTEEVRGRLNRVLGKFVGTHNFHNFTSKMDPMDPASNRYILSFEASKPFTAYGTEFVRCTVIGQSFMLHQIRKMIGSVVAIMRGVASESVIDMAFCKDQFITVPMAPELGLFLDECLFASYNKRFCQTHQELSLRNVRKEVDLFKQNLVYKHIAETDRRDSVVPLWLKSLNERNYTGFAAPLEPVKGLGVHVPVAVDPPQNLVKTEAGKAEGIQFPVTVYPPQNLVKTEAGKAEWTAVALAEESRHKAEAPVAEPPAALPAVDGSVLPSAKVEVLASEGAAGAGGVTI